MSTPHTDPTEAAPVADGKIRTLIVDDESLARRGLELRLAAHEDIEIIGQCRNGREALEAIASLQPDLMFLDIQMPGIDGFEVIRRMQSDQMPLVVFVTAFDQYAIKAFDVHAVDYVLKPIEDCRLATAIERVREHRQHQDRDLEKKRLIDLICNITGEEPSQIDEMLEQGVPAAQRYPDKLPIRDAGETTLVPVSQIAWIEAAGDYMCVHQQVTDTEGRHDRVHVLRSTMKDLEQQLDPQHFQRIHRSTMVNLNHIEKVCSHINGEYFLVLKHGPRIKMSRSYRNKIRHIL